MIVLQKKEEVLEHDLVCCLGILSRSFPIHGITLLGILRFPLEVDIVG